MAGVIGSIDTNGNSVTIAAVVSGGGGLVKTGPGTLTLMGSNTYSGTTGVIQGVLSVSTIVPASGQSSVGTSTSPIVLGDGTHSTIVPSGGQSNVGSSMSPIVLGDGTHSGTLSYTGITASYANGFIVNAGGGEIDMTTPGQQLTIDAQCIEDDSHLTIGGVGVTGVSSPIQGSGGLTKTGPGTLVLMAANSYSGSTNVQDGILRLAHGATLASSSAVTLGDGTDSGILELGDASGPVNQTVASLTSSDTAAVVGGSAVTSTLTINNPLTDTFSGTLGGAGDQNNLALVKAGAGELTLTAANTFTGGTTVNNGVLQLGSDTALGNDAPLTVDGGTLDLNSHSITVSSLTTDSGSTGGTITDMSGTSATLVVNGETSTAFSGSIDDGSACKVSLVKYGGGTLTLTGTSGYTGGTSVEGGVLQLSSRVPIVTRVAPTSTPAFCSWATAEVSLQVVPSHWATAPIAAARAARSATFPAYRARPR